MSRDHPLEIRQRAISLVRDGHSNRDVADRLGVPYGTIGYWVHQDRARRNELPGLGPRSCFRCHERPVARHAYAYLLGLYLGDGHIVKHARSHSLSIYCADSWPGLIEDAAFAIDTVLPGSNAHFVQRQGCTEVKRYSQHWPCMFPQHGPGMKHTRLIELADWQREIVEALPWDFIRGLIHSDGCRATNWTVRTVAGQRKRYEYPRYFLSNKSDDIKRLFTAALDRVGVEWRVANQVNISIARRDSVALMDRHVGPKY